MYFMKLVIAATTHLDVYSLPEARVGKKKKLDALSLLNTVDPPTSPVPGLTFRAARLGYFSESSSSN